MKAVTASEMQYIDRETINSFGIPADVLMAMAGKSLADYIKQKFVTASTVSIICGSGNNGGDGFVIAYFLYNNAYDVTIYHVGDESKMSASTATFASLCKKCDIPIMKIDSSHIDQSAKKKSIFGTPDLIIDAIFGTGFKGTPRKEIREVIKRINEYDTPVFSVDMPSGLKSNGVIEDSLIVNATETGTIGLPKISLVTYPGKAFAGQVTVHDIGFPKVLTESDSLKRTLIDEAYIHEYNNLPRNEDTHKGEEGHLLLVGGFSSMEGAIMLSAMAALETGIGLISLLTSQGSRSTVAGKIPELMCHAYETFFTDNTFDVTQWISHCKAKKYTALVIGPGLGRDTLSEALFFKILDSLEETSVKRVVIDGDGLYHLKKYIEDKNLNTSCIITPHFKEASYLSDYSIEELKKDRVGYAEKIAKDFSLITILKGPNSIVTDGENTYINTTGNAALAIAGSGDVLAGIIGALAAKKEYSETIAASVGVYTHGRAGDLFCEAEHVSVMKASDIVQTIRKSLFNS